MLKTSKNIYQEKYSIKLIKWIKKKYYPIGLF